VHFCWIQLTEGLPGGAFLALGWVAGPASPRVCVRFGAAPVVLIIIGGVPYTVGAISYHRRSPDPVPSVFGYREIHPSFVGIAALLHYGAIEAFIA
jgi:hemolysin III